MSMEYDAIIVGGGMAGLTSAAYLCRYGYHTLLLEKGKKTGGLVNTFWHQGFAFDAGIRAFENSGIIRPMLKSLDLDLEFVKNPVSIGIGSHWTQLTSRQSLQDYAHMLTTIFPENKADIAKIAEEMQKVMRYMEVIYGIDNPLFLENMRAPEYLVKTLLPWLLKYQVNIGKANQLNEPVQLYLRRFTDNQALVDMIVQHFFKDTPTFFALSYFGLYLDYSYPMGGTGVLAEKVSERVLSSGGKIMTQVAVESIDTTNREITTSDGEKYQYKKLIWAADQRALYSAIKGIQPPNVEKQRSLVNQSEGNDSILTLFIGVNLNRDYFKSICGTHAFYTPKTDGLSSLPTWEEAAGKGKAELLKWVGSYLNLTTYEISCPVLRDASLAPEGRTGLIVSTLMPYHLVSRISDEGDYESFKRFCIDTITQTLEKSMFPDLLKHISFSLCSTPMTIEKETGNTHGAITGWSFTNEKIPAESHFKKITKSIHTPIQDILQCGQWTFSPSGLPVSILTGKLAADEVRKTLK